MPIMKCQQLGTDNIKVSLVGYLMSTAGYSVIDVHSLWRLKKYNKKHIQKKPKWTNKNPKKPSIVTDSKAK